MDFTGPRGFDSSIGEVGGLGSWKVGSENEFALEFICCDGRRGLIVALLALFTELKESLRWA